MRRRGTSIPEPYARAETDEEGAAAESYLRPSTVETRGGFPMPAPTLVVGAPCWIDLYSSDTARAAEFYGQLFGWTAEPPEEGFGGYFTFTKDGKHVGGCMHNDGQTGVPDVWTVYLMTDDIEATAEAAVRNGGQVHLAPMAVAENGHMAMLADAGGAAVGVWQPGTQQGFEVRNELGTPSWFELHTRDYDATVGFYRDVFEWDAHAVSDTPEFRYTTLGEGDDQLAGIMDATAFLPDGVPAHWSIYFGVPDADAALKEIVALGGKVLRPAEDTPYGRLAQAADPTGTSFKLVAD
jgi:predicted enzyme related to lactoylglutathione lyase